MGKRTKAKVNDLPTISMSGDIPGGGAASPSTAKCPITFQAKVKKTNVTRHNDVPVNLSIKGTIVLMLISGTEIGRLSFSQSKMVIDCSEMGVRYKGRILVKNDLIYARFERSS